MEIINEVAEIYYDKTKDYESQSDAFKEYLMELYEEVPKILYPNFNDDGSISYFVEDALFNASITRVQQDPFSTSNRAVKELVIDIEVKIQIQ